MKRYEKHIFICGNKRPEGHPKGCCADKQAEIITQAFKSRIAELKLNQDIRINSSGLLGSM